MQKLYLGISPCPNDTFIFDALHSKTIQTENLDFHFIIKDIQELNTLVLNRQIDIAKVSCALLPKILDDYYILSSGGAAGFGMGPLVIAKNTFSQTHETSNIKVNIPGKDTTAHLLFSHFYPNHTNKIFTPFDQIENNISTGISDWGIFIHEKRFNYSKEKLKKISDMGSLWDSTYNLPLPLGCVVVSKKLLPNIAKQISFHIQQSILNAFQHFPNISNFIIQHAQDMDNSVILKHITMYVNLYTLNFADIGKKCIQKLLDIHPYKTSHKPQFI